MLLKLFSLRSLLSPLGDGGKRTFARGQMFNQRGNKQSRFNLGELSPQAARHSSSFQVNKT